MITAADLRERVKRVPFSPFRIRTSFGQFFDVVNPAFVMVGKRIVVVGKPPHPDDEEFDLIQEVSIPHITSVERLENDNSKTS